MRAMVCTRPGTVEMLDVAEPEPRADEVVLNVALAGIYGGELHGTGRPGFRQPPLVMGHEFAGATDDGRGVAVNPMGHCGSCHLCGAGADNLCRERAILGIRRAGVFPLEQGAETFTELMHGRSDAVKALLRPDAA